MPLCPTLLSPPSAVWSHLAGMARGEGHFPRKVKVGGREGGGNATMPKPEGGRGPSLIYRGAPLPRPARKIYGKIYIFLRAWQNKKGVFVSVYPHNWPGRFGPMAKWKGGFSSPFFVHEVARCVQLQCVHAVHFSFKYEEEGKRRMIVLAKTRPGHAAAQPTSFNVSYSRSRIVLAY